MQEVLDERGDGGGLNGGEAELVGDNGRGGVDGLRARLHALEDDVEHLGQRGLGRRLVDLRARHEEDVVARPHRQQQRLFRLQGGMSTSVIILGGQP